MQEGRGSERSGLQPVSSGLRQTRLRSPSPLSSPPPSSPLPLPLKSSAGESKGPWHSLASTARHDPGGLSGQRCAGPTHRRLPQVLPGVGPPRHPGPFPARQGEGSVLEHLIYMFDTVIQGLTPRSKQPDPWVCS